MNFSHINLSEALQNELTAMEKSRRIPHAVIVTGGNESTRKDMCSFLSMWAVCKEHNKPCGTCSGCLKAKGNNHIDIYFAKGSGKTNGIAVEEIRNITRDTAIIPNDADRKVYILENADKRMGAESLNAFLKTLEEPSQDILFLLSVSNLKALPQTVLSRCTVFTLESEYSVSEETKENAIGILQGILDINELSLLKATWVLNSRKNALEILPVVRAYLCDALSLSVNAQSLSKEEISAKLQKKLTKSKLIGLMDATSDAISKTDRNVNMALLSTWLCGEYRRILCAM